MRGSRTTRTQPSHRGKKIIITRKLRSRHRQSTATPTRGSPVLLSCFRSGTAGRRQEALTRRASKAYSLPPAPGQQLPGPALGSTLRRLRGVPHSLPGRPLRLAEGRQGTSGPRSPGAARPGSLCPRPVMEAGQGPGGRELGDPPEVRARVWQGRSRRPRELWGPAGLEFPLSARREAAAPRSHACTAVRLRAGPVRLRPAPGSAVPCSPARRALEACSSSTLAPRRRFGPRRNAQGRRVSLPQTLAVGRASIGHLAAAARPCWVLVRTHPCRGVAALTKRKMFSELSKFLKSGGRLQSPRLPFPGKGNGLGLSTHRIFSLLICFAEVFFFLCFCFFSRDVYRQEGASFIIATSKYGHYEV